MTIATVGRGGRAMRQIADTVRQLQHFYSTVAVQFNRHSDVSVPRGEADAVISCLCALQTMVFPYSPSLSQMVADLCGGLFLTDAQGIVRVNPFRFGKMEAVLLFLDSPDFVGNFSQYLHTNWPDVDAGTCKLLHDAALASDRFSFNQVGVAAREICILLAQKVFRREMDEEGKIGPADAFGMLECFLRHTLKGDRYDDVRGYAKKTVKLADHVTHIKCEDAIAMETAVTAVVALVALINTVSRGA